MQNKINSIIVCGTSVHDGLVACRRLRLLKHFLPFRWCPIFVAQTATSLRYDGQRRPSRLRSCVWSCRERWGHMLASCWREECSSLQRWDFLETYLTYRQTELTEPTCKDKSRFEEIVPEFFNAMVLLPPTFGCQWDPRYIWDRPMEYQGLWRSERRLGRIWKELL